MGVSIDQSFERLNFEFDVATLFGVFDQTWLFVDPDIMHLRNDVLT